MRCYNGCPDSKLQAILDAEAKAMAMVKAIRPEAHCTYFHPTGCHESGFQIHEWGRCLSGFHQNKIDACFEAFT